MKTRALTFFMVTLVLYMSFSAFCMDLDDDIDSMRAKAQYLSFVRGYDPNRFGELDFGTFDTKITISEGNREIIDKCKNSKSVGYYGGDDGYPDVRNLLAIAVEECEDQKSMSNAVLAEAVRCNDAPLVAFTLNHSASATIEIQDLLTGAKRPIVQHATSFVILNLLQNAGAKLDPQEGGNMVHQACGEKYDPEILEVYLKISPTSVNHQESPSRYTPLERLVRSEVGDRDTDKERALRKIALLINAGADVSLTSMRDKSILALLREHINPVLKEWQEAIDVSQKKGIAVDELEKKILESAKKKNCEWNTIMTDHINNLLNPPAKKE